jgi:ribosome biogenesis protein BRX1
MLIEIGPRFCLQPIKAFDGTLSGDALWQNEEYISPSKLRGKKYSDFLKKRQEKSLRKSRKEHLSKVGQDPDGYLQDAFI